MRRILNSAHQEYPHRSQQLILIHLLRYLSKRNWEEAKDSWALRHQQKL